jgi:hypothetical protein
MRGAENVFLEFRKSIFRQSQSFDFQKRRTTEFHGYDLGNSTVELDGAAMRADGE